MDSEIKIFVSHRIDLDSVLVDNPVYCPVRCGAVFDHNPAPKIAGDDTGDNISAHRMSLSELTVQYWAWKNVEAEYYGLCHYRRYLSFAKERFPVDDYGMVREFSLEDATKEKYGLLDVEAMCREIRNYDAVVSVPSPVRRQPTPRGKVQTVRELWDAHDGLFIKPEAIDKMFRLIAELAPEYEASAKEYFAGDHHRGYNCYVMKKELFFRLCEFQFPILFAMEEWLQKQPYRDTLGRIPGYIGEMLYGIFTYHIAVHERRNVAEKQLVLFQNTVQIENRGEYLRLRFQYRVGSWLRSVADLLLPIGSRRRMTVKSLWHRMRKK